MIMIKIIVIGCIIVVAVALTIIIYIVVNIEKGSRRRIREVNNLSSLNIDNNLNKEEQ